MLLRERKATIKLKNCEIIRVKNLIQLYIMLHAILIINKAGGLVYNKDFGKGISKLTSNEYLVLAGTFHGYNIVLQ